MLSNEYFSHLPVNSLLSPSYALAWAMILFAPSVGSEWFVKEWWRDSALGSFYYPRGIEALCGTSKLCNFVGVP